MPRRRLPDWISSYAKFTENSESPISFHTWAGLSCLAAALQRKVYLRWGHTTLYPNQYIVLVGPSGQARKGEPITIASKMVTSLRLPQIGEDNSMEAVIREMKNAVTNFTDKSSGKIKFQCAVSCFVEELSVFVGQQNTAFLAYLTNWYDSRDRWKRTTKHQGTDELLGVCFNLLAATAPDWIPYMFSREAIGGGFTSRCLFIVEEGKAKIIPNPNLVPIDEGLRSSLKHDLELISTLSGEVMLDKKALDAYTAWYEKEEKKIQSGRPAIDDPLFSGYVSRRATHVKKLAMLCMASRGDELVITLRDFERALAFMESVEAKMTKAFHGIGKPKYVEETELILTYIAKRRKATKSDILKTYIRTVDSYTLDLVIKNLTDMKLVRAIRDTAKGE